MTIDDFNEWRKNYDQMSYGDQVEFYNRVAIEHPSQLAFDTEAFSQFFAHIVRQQKVISVLEFGGWKGELADKILSIYSDFILFWTNYEISQKAIENTVCRHFQYYATISHDYLWNIYLPRATVFVSSHAIEHIKEHELELLFRALPQSIRWIGLQAPLAMGPTDWTNYHGSHILECGWAKIIEILKSCDFELFMERNEFRGFTRQHNNAGLESSRSDPEFSNSESAAISA